MSSQQHLYFMIHDIAFPAQSATHVRLQMHDWRNRLFDAGATEEATSVDGKSIAWTRFVPVEFKFEQRQNCVASIISARQTLTVTFQLSQVVSARGGILTLPVGTSGSYLVVNCASADVLPYDFLRIRFAAAGLRALNFFSDFSDTYVRVIHVLPNGAEECLHQSDVVRQSVNPVWNATPLLKAAQLRGRTLSDRCLRIECWYSGVFSDKLMGSALLSISDFASTRFECELVKKGEMRGKLRFQITESDRLPRFAELLSSGLNMNVAVAIDFTGSNGDPSEPTSLHYCGPSGLIVNDYTSAMRSVCDVLLEYDTDKMVPAYGFGARLPNGETSHCFHLNALADPNVFGLDGIMQAYCSALRAVRLSGPTNFAPTIKQAERAARATPQTYTVLLILTDGCITDTDDTIDAIVACGNAPLSIVIVGIGSADFTTMDVLDGDEERLTDRRGVRCLRDLVQFVPYRDYVNAPREHLAAEVLAEVPRQVEEWACFTRYSEANATHF